MENKSFTLKQLFSVVDGRLSTKMEDVYEILNIVANESLTTIALPILMNRLEEVKPKWYIKDLGCIKDEIGDDFETLMKHLDNVKTTYEVTSL
jgi:hypothetical protein